MFRTLMTARRFAPLFWCQFLSAFNDNFVRQMLAMLILFRFGGEDAGPKIPLARRDLRPALDPAVADRRRDRRRPRQGLVARRLKFAEIGVQLIAAAGFVFASLALLYLALFGLGCVSALFGPIKYGILPDHLRREELVAGNALVEGATFAAIICGLVLGGFAAAEGRSRGQRRAAAHRRRASPATASSRYIPPTGVGAPGLKVNYNSSPRPGADHASCAPTTGNGSAALGDSWFWMVGAITLSLVPVIIKSRIGGGIEVETAINLFFAVGIAAGSLGAAALSHGRIELAPAPFMLLLMAALAIHLGPCDPRDCRRRAREVPLAEFFTQRARPADRARDLRSIPPRRACSWCRSSPRCRPGRARTGARASSAPSIR